MGAEFGDPRLPERFWSKVEVDAETGCWLWTAGLMKGYGQFRVGALQMRAHRVAYDALVEGACPPLLDHECRAKRCCNPRHLRPSTTSQNNRYRRRTAPSTSRFTGVSRHKISDKWVAYIRIDNELKHLGCFDEEVDAARAYDASAEQFGEFAILNFPEDSAEVREKYRYVERTTSSLFRGVSWHAAKNKWMSSIQVDNKAKYLGYFNDEEEAARAFDAAAVQYGRKLNFPEEHTNER